MNTKNLLLFFSFFLLIFFWNCQQEENLILTPEETNQLEKKPVKDDPIINSFQLIVNESDTYEIGEDLLPLIDFTSTNNYELKYKVSHPEGFSEVQVYMYYDINADSQEGYSAIQYGSHLVENYEASSDIEYTQILDGFVVELPDYDENHFTSEGELMDQKATYYDDTQIINPDPLGLADQYFIQIMVWSENGFARKNSYLWVKAKVGSGEIYVNSIDIISEPGTKKNTSKPIVTVELFDLTGICANTQITYSWGGNIIGDNYKRRISDNDGDGIIIIEGPEYRNNKSGEIIFTVNAIKKVDNVYNPYLHSELEWPWPEVEPSATLDVL